MPDAISDSDKDKSPRACPNWGHAFEELYAAHFNPLVAYLRAQFRSCTQHAEEIAQDAFEKVAATQDIAAIGNIKAYLWRAAYNLAVSDIRTKRLAMKYQNEAKALFSPEDGYRLTPEHVFATSQQTELAVAVLRRMPEQRRRAFILTRIEGLSHTEASEQMGISRPAVSKHVAKATAELYAALHNDSKCGKK